MKKKLQKKEPIRSFQSKAPDWIIPIYNTVQSALNSVLENKTYRDKLIKVDLTRTINGKKQKIARGTLWKEIQAIIGNPLKDKINNAAWYNRIMMTNIIFLLESRQEQIKVAQILKENNNIINQDLRAKLTAEGLYPSNAELQNLVRSNDISKLPKHVVLKLDYAFADKQMFYLDNNFNCHIQVLSKKEAKKQDVSGWKMFQIYIPTYIRKENLIKVCKPMFVYSKKTEQMICQVPYQVVAESHPEFQNILGIDMGKVKPYSATVLYRNSNQTVKHLYKRKAVQTHRKSRRKQNYLFKQSVLKFQKDAQIVAFLYDKAENTLALVSEPESMCSLDNNLAKRGFLKLNRQITYQNLSL